MNDYDTQKIEYPDLPTYLKNLQTISTYDFSNFSYDDIYNKFHDLALSIPCLGAKLKHEKFNGFKLYRVRMEKTISDTEDMNVIQTFSFPPSTFCNSNGRANVKNKSVFYCTNEAYPAIKECNGGIDEIGFLSIWEVSTVRDLIYMSCLPEVLPAQNRWKEYGTYHHNFLIDRQVDEDPNLLAHEVSLRKLITDKFMIEKSPYFISSMIANEYLYHNDVDIVLYPSAQTFQDYINFAIHPNVALNQLKCTKIVKFKINAVKKDQITFNLKLIGDITSNDRVKWRKVEDKDGLDLGFQKEKK